MRVVSICVTTLVCAFIVWGLTFNLDPLNFLLGALGGLFGFWLSYTGRLRQLFRKVG